VDEGDRADAPHRLLDGRLASADASRRPCRRSSDEIVCRLFFTRWWISRIVASLDRSRRSRRRSSEMSRSSTTAPVTSSLSIRGRHRTSTVTSGPARSPRWPGGGSRTPCAPGPPGGRGRRSACLRCWRGCRSGAGPTPRSVTCRPPHRRVEEDHAVADAGASSVGPASARTEEAGGDHSGEPVEHLDVGALELTGLAADRRRRLAGEDPTVVPPCLTGMHSSRTGSRSVSLRSSPSMISRARATTHQRTVVDLEDPPDPVAAIEGLAVVGRTCRARRDGRARQRRSHRARRRGRPRRTA